LGIFVSHPTLSQFYFFLKNPWNKIAFSFLHKKYMLVLINGQHHPSLLVTQSQITQMTPLQPPGTSPSQNHKCTFLLALASTRQKLWFSNHLNSYHQTIDLALLGGNEAMNLFSKYAEIHQQQIKEIREIKVDQRVLSPLCVLAIDSMRILHVGFSVHII
jgi:hypothetical protein